MSTSPETPSTPRSTPPDAALVTAMADRLRAEYERTDSPANQAVLLHELGVLEELIGDEAAAARDHLGAVNAEPEFREPLERLVVLIERRQSYKNLGKLLERLVRVAVGPAERARALADFGLFKAEHEHGLEEAKELLDDATAEQPEDASLWLALEQVAASLDDTSLRTRALAARAELTQHPGWRGLLLIDLARELASIDEVQGAFDALDRAAEGATIARFPALLTLEQLGHRAGRTDVTARALEAQVDLVLQSRAEPPTGDAHGVPHHARSNEYAVDALLRAAYARRSQGSLDAATSLLDRALGLLPDEPALLHARTTAADALGDTHTITELARRRLSLVPSGPLAAAAWLRVAEEAAAEQNPTEALAAVDRAVGCDPGAIPALALRLDLLAGMGDGTALAAAFEAMAERVEADDAKARMYLLAAYTWACTADDVDGAKAALTQAGMYGATPGTVARVGRLLATLAGQPLWYEESTRRLLATGAAESEQASLWLELALLRIERGDLEGLVKSLESLTAAPGGRWLGSALGAFLLPLLTDDPAQSATNALAVLADVEPDPDVSRGLKQIVARRTSAAGQRDKAIEELTKLHSTDEADLVVAEQLATELRRGEQPVLAAEILDRSAGVQDDGALGASMHLEAGLLRFRAGARSAAIDSFDLAATAAPDASAVLTTWALRAVDPNHPEARRRALDTTVDDPQPALTALERFSLEVTADGDSSAAEGALASMGEDTTDDLVVAAQLARALWQPEEDPSTIAALDALGERSAEAAAMALAARCQRLAESGADADTRLEAAAAWAEADPAVAAAIEWIAMAAAAADRDQERAARQALARRIGGDSGIAIESSARIVGAMAGDDGQLLLAATTPAARLTNLELAMPGCDPRRRATALGELGDTLGDDTAAMAQALAGYSHLASGNLAQAETSFRMVVEAFPNEVIGWEGLRAWAERAEDRVVLAEASAALGDILQDAGRGAELWEEAGLILLEELEDSERAELAFERAVARDVRRAVAFDKLFRMVRARKDGQRLLDLVAARLEVADDPEEIAKLFWERARVLRNQDRFDDALAALENVTLIEPDHVGALALYGEVSIRRGMFPEAAENLARLATLAEAPTQQRLMSGIAAVDLFENKLGQTNRALEVLLGLYRAGLSTLPVRERLARTAAKVGEWRSATEVLEELMYQRETPAARVEAARLAMAIHRDRLGDLAGAEAATTRLLEEAPDDGEALDVVLVGAFPDEVTRELLAKGRDALGGRLESDPLQPELIDRLARIAAMLETAPLRQATLGALVAVGEGTAEIDHELDILQERVARLPQIAIDPNSLPDLCDPADYGPVGDLVALAAPTIAEALGPTLASLGAHRKQRVDPRAGLPVRNEVAAWAGALGLGEFDLYVGGTDDDGVVGVAAERPALVLGARVTAPLCAAHRQVVARELFALRRGVTVLRHYGATDVAAIVIALCRLAGVEVPSPQYAMLGEFERRLGRALPRKLKKPLGDIAERVRDEGHDPRAWIAAATSSLDRLAAIASGDVSHVLAASPTTRGQLGASIESKERAARLLSFVLSKSYLALREQLGMGVR
ncbi:MAG: hypothetical protein JW751_12335 [Polyangiaceae bacterium]|nr:hypothetical protein [Polyangiaceae bacterium]